MKRKHKRELRAVFRILQPDATLVRANNHSANCQTESSSGSVLSPNVGRVFLENLSDTLGRDLRTGVSNVDPVRIVRPAIAIPALGRRRRGMTIRPAIPET